MFLPVDHPIDYGARKYFVKAFRPAPDSGLLPAVLDDIRPNFLYPKGPNAGILFGLSVYGSRSDQRVPLSLPMSRCIYKVLMGEKITASELKRIDPDFYKHRVAAVLEEGGVDQMEEVLCEELYFVGVSGAADTERLPAELCKGGRTRRVTEQNKDEYVTLLVEHHLVGRCRRARCSCRRIL